MALYIDLSKAFDSINRDLLDKVLTASGMPSNVVMILKDLYQENTGTIHGNNGNSHNVNINCGIRQECPLSPTLFKIFLSYALNSIQDKLPKGVAVAIEKFINMILYADDIVLLQYSDSELQEAVNLIKEIFSKFGLQINIKKTKSQILCKSSTGSSELIIKAGDDTFEQVHVFTYLGHEISDETVEDSNDGYSYRISVARCKLSQMQHSQI